MNSFSNSAFARFFTEFPKLLLAQLINAVAFAAFTALFVLIGYLTGFNNIIVWCLGIIPSMPFFAGLVMTVRKIGIEKKDVPVAKTFFGTVKENFKAFLLHGVLTQLLLVRYLRLCIIFHCSVQVLHTVQCLPYMFCFRLFLHLWCFMCR